MVVRCQERCLNSCAVLAVLLRAVWWMYIWLKDFDWGPGQCEVKGRQVDLPWEIPRDPKKKDLPVLY